MDIENASSAMCHDKFPVKECKSPYMYNFSTAIAISQNDIRDEMSGEK